jgi:L-fucose isomerase-like protein
MNEFLNKFEASQLIGLVAVVGGLLLATISVIATQWRRVRIAALETNFKRQLLEKGVPLAQIEQVVKSNGESASYVPTGNENADKAALVQRMVDSGYESEDIERVLRAFQPASSTTGKNPASPA